MLANTPEFEILTLCYLKTIQVCGKTFPPKCKLEASTIYKCEGSDGKPTVAEKCGEGGCTVTNGDNHCNKDTCTCPGEGFAPIRGSELPASCNANANSIYYYLEATAISPSFFRSASPAPCASRCHCLTVLPAELVAVIAKVTRRSVPRVSLKLWP